MTETLQKALDAVTAQQPKKRGPVWMAGEQLKDILRESPALAGVVLEDLSGDQEALAHCEAKIRAFAKANGGCCIPSEADRIIREHFGLGEAAEAEPRGAGVTLNFEDFL